MKDRVINPVRNWNLITEELINTYISACKNKVVYNRGKSLNQYLDDGSYKLIYTPTSFLYTDLKELAVGIGIKKIVVFSISVNLEFKEDLLGQYGVGPNTFYIPVADEVDGSRWIDFLNSSEYKMMALATKTNRQFLKNTFIQHLDLDLCKMPHKK